MKGSAVIALAAVATVGCLALGCGTPRKIDLVRQKEMVATLALSRNEIEEERRVIQQAKRDTVTWVDPEGRKVIIMKAVKDDETGEMVATETLDAAVITARFRNVAERHGKIDLRFEVIVPAAMQDTRWQLRFYPDMFILEDSLRLESVVITGQQYRRAQLRGYEQYERFLRSIINDTTAFIDYRNLEVFIQRNLPELWRYRDDSTFVSDSLFESRFGVTAREAIEHYTNHFAQQLNERRRERSPEMFARYVKAPIITEGVRLDTVMRSSDGDFVYHYTQTITTRPKLRKVDIILSGDIFEGDRKLYSMSRSAPLTFYISSLSAFVDGTERYLTRVIERRAEANTACYVDFASGKADIDLSLGHNATEMRRIRGNILELLGNQTYEMDSIVIAASASPEGTVKANGALAERRAAAVASYFQSYIRHYRDSVQRALDEEARNSYTLTVDEKGREHVGRAVAQKAAIPEIRFISRSSGENWDMLTFLVDTDTTLTREDKRSFIRHLDTPDVDLREQALQKEPYYRHLREVLYPRLRTVKFDFFLHRKGMVKDTVHTTELDTVYMKGVEALRERDYEKALTYLRSYRDYNTAIAYVSLDYNASAMAILKELPRSPQVNYMLAVLHARNGDDEKAVQCYLAACREDRSYVFRGNLDPEIYILIQRYGLNKEDDDPDEGAFH